MSVVDGQLLRDTSGTVLLEVFILGVCIRPDPMGKGAGKRISAKPCVVSDKGSIVWKTSAPILTTQSLPFEK